MNFGVVPRKINLGSASLGFAMTFRRSDCSDKSISPDPFRHKKPGKARNQHRELGPQAKTVKSTFGETFSGLLIEAVTDPKCPSELALCVHNLNTAKIHRHFEYRGVTYVPGPIPSGLGEVVRFPSVHDSLGSTQNLVPEMRRFLSMYLKQDARAIDLLIAFVLGSWFTDCFRVAPVLCLHGPDNEVRLVLRLLNILCFHPALVSDIDVAALRNVPAELHMTLLVNEADLSPRVQIVLLSSARRDFCLVRGDRLFDLFGARALHCHSTLRSIGLNLPITPRRCVLPKLTKAQERAFAEAFQSKLLAYRINNHSRVREFEVDVDSVYLELEDQMTTWFASLPSDLELRKSVRLAFAESHDRLLAARYEDPRCLVAETALMFSHRKGAEYFYVRELAEKVNDLLLARHADFKLENRRVGAVLKDLGIRTHRVTRGYRVKLDEVTRKQIHRIAVSYHVLSTKAEISHCADCTNEFRGPKDANVQ